MFEHSEDKVFWSQLDFAEILIQTLLSCVIMRNLSLFVLKRGDLLKIGTSALGKTK